MAAPAATLTSRGSPGPRPTTTTRPVMSRSSVCAGGLTCRDDQVPYAGLMRTDAFDTRPVTTGLPLPWELMMTRERTLLEIRRIGLEAPVDDPDHLVAVAGLDRGGHAADGEGQHGGLEGLGLGLELDLVVTGRDPVGHLLGGDAGRLAGAEGRRRDGADLQEEVRLVLVVGAPAGWPAGPSTGVRTASSATRLTSTSRKAGEKSCQPTSPSWLTVRAAARVAEEGGWSVATTRSRITVASTMPPRMPATQVVL